MDGKIWEREVTRRSLIKGVAGGVALSALQPLERIAAAAEPPFRNDIFRVTGIPNRPFRAGGNHHAGVEALLGLMGGNGLPFYRSAAVSGRGGPDGLIAPDDVVLLKVNAQWKYRGATNSDLVRGIIQAVLDHPDGFNGEVVIVENGQGRGSLACDTSQAYGGDSGVHANANNPAHSFLFLIDGIFRDPRVSGYLLDPIRAVFIGYDDHRSDGYRTVGRVSYPCFTTAGGRRVELKEGVWDGSGHAPRLKLLNVPVLKHHDTGGSEITASLKHVYGLLSMADGNSGYRHYEGLGATCGAMMVRVRTPSLNILDATWVSHRSLSGYPAETTVRCNQILASQDPVALDWWAARHVLYPLDANPRHHPDFPGISGWLGAARDRINRAGGLADPSAGIKVGRVTMAERRMRVLEATPAAASRHPPD